MKINEKGFSTPLALAVIFSLSVLTLSYAMLVSATARKINSFNFSVQTRKDLDNSIYEILNKFSKLKDETNDFEFSPFVQEMQNEYREINLQIKDVSTGINTHFMKKEVMESESIARYLNNFNCKISDYGWVNEKYSDKKLIEDIQKDFNTHRIAPLVSSLPLYNIHMMDKDFLLAVLEYCKVPEAETAVHNLYQLREVDFNKKEIAKVLKIKENSQFFELIGFKTLFWEFDFEKSGYQVKAVVAAIPDEKDSQKIGNYILVEKKIMHKGDKSC